MNDRLQVAIAAAVGGTSPTLLALAIYLTTTKHAALPSSSGYYVGLLLLAALGYIIVRIWDEKVPKRALYLGLGLPALLHVATAAHQNQDAAEVLTSPPAAATSTHLSLFESTAWAQELPAAPQSTQMQALKPADRKLRVLFTTVPSDTTVVFITSNGQKHTKPVDWADVATSGALDVDIPSDAARVTFDSALTRNSQTLSLRKAPQQTMRLKIEDDFASGLLRAFGLKAFSELEVKPVKDEFVVTPAVKTTT